jgi:hypothetical protein
MYPANVDSAEPAPGVNRQKYGSRLIGQTIRFREQQRDAILEVTMLDCGTSHLRGDWFEILDDGASESRMITAGELEDIMAKRVQ